MVGQFVWMKQERAVVPGEVLDPVAQEDSEEDLAGVGEVDVVSREVDTSCLRFELSGVVFAARFSPCWSSLSLCSRRRWIQWRQELRRQELWGAELPF